MPDMPSRSVSPSDHDRHDALLIAQAAAGDELHADEQGRADALLAACVHCRALAEDLGAISRAVAAEPVPARPRDFRLTPGDAQRARGSWLDRLLGRVMVPDIALLRPLAGSALVLGLLLVVVGTALPAGFAGGTRDVVMSEPAGPAVTDDGVAASKAPASAQPSAAGLQMEAPAAPEAAEAREPVDASGGADAAGATDPEAAEAREASEAASPEAAMLRMTDAQASPGPAEGDSASGAAPVTPDDEQVLDVMAVGGDAETSPVAGTDAAAESFAATASEADGASVDDRATVVTLGAIVALAGALLLAMFAFARSREDPLLR